MLGDEIQGVSHRGELPLAKLGDPVALDLRMDGSDCGHQILAAVGEVDDASTAVGMIGLAGDVTPLLEVAQQRVDRLLAGVERARQIGGAHGRGRRLGSNRSAAERWPDRHQRASGLESRRAPHRHDSRDRRGQRRRPRASAGSRLNHPVLHPARTAGAPAWPSSAAAPGPNRTHWKPRRRPSKAFLAGPCLSLELSRHGHRFNSVRL